MKTLIIETEAKVVTSIREMVDPMTGTRRNGLVYFQKLSDGGLVARTLSEETVKEYLLRSIEEQKILLPIKNIIAETT